MAKRWVRYLIPVMVEVDIEDEKVTRVVTLPEEIREDRDDRGHFLIYDEGFVRRHSDSQPQTSAFCSAEPRWDYDLRMGPPKNWPEPLAWEEGFDLTEADERYGEVPTYAEPER